MGLRSEKQGGWKAGEYEPGGKRPWVMSVEGNIAADLLEILIEEQRLANKLAWVQLTEEQRAEFRSLP